MFSLFPAIPKPKSAVRRQAASLGFTDRKILLNILPIRQVSSLKEIAQSTRQITNQEHTDKIIHRF